MWMSMTLVLSLALMLTPLATAPVAAQGGRPRAGGGAHRPHDAADPGTPVPA
jgi:hypothetical protein